MANFKCCICSTEQESETVPEICSNCGTLYGEWQNPSTGKIERKAKKAPKIAHEKIKPYVPPVYHKPVTPKTPKMYKTPAVVSKPKTSYKPKAPSPLCKLSIPRNYIDVTLPLGRSENIKVFLSNTGTGSITGKAISYDPEINILNPVINFTYSYTLNIKVNSSKYPGKKSLIVSVDTNGGMESICISLNVLDLKFFDGLKYFFKPWA